MIQNPILRVLVSPLTIIYSGLVRLRLGLYRLGILKAVKVRPRVVSIGNLTLGGTGKTPTVIRLAQLLSDRGNSVAILGHGYRGSSGKDTVLVSDGSRILVDSSISGDEAQLCARRLKGVPVVVGRTKWKVSQWIDKNLAVDWIILDDGFQHLKLGRDCDIVLVDSGWQGEQDQIVPLGRLREPLPGLKRADVVVIVEEAGVSANPNLPQELKRHAPEAAFFTACREFAAIGAVDGSPGPALEELRRRKLLAFCGLAQPSQFFSELQRQQFLICDTLEFPDHHLYTQGDLQRIVKRAESAGAEALITTAKDAVNCAPRAFGDWSCYVYEIRMSIDSEEKLLEACLRQGL
ncbi:MAG: tetraacyldisaccharide 4'-kinase [Acidobacteriia bacterium]|nr:tetraacyldisaccharide 4'-kinase [Terriglobia bacterium]